MELADHGSTCNVNLYRWQMRKKPCDCELGLLRLIARTANAYMRVETEYRLQGGIGGRRTVRNLIRLRSLLDRLLTQAMPDEHWRNHGQDRP